MADEAARRAVSYGRRAPGLTVPMAHEAAKRARRADSWQKAAAPGEIFSDAGKQAQIEYVRPWYKGRNTRWELMFSALPPIADKTRPWRHVRFVPTAVVGFRP